MKKSVSFLLILCGISSSAFAASSSIDFAGTASAFCSFSGINNGSLSVNPSNTAQIGTSVTGGTPATFSIQYLGTPTLSVQEVQGFATKPSGVNDNDFGYTTSVTSSSSVSFTANQGFITGTYNGGNADQLTVNMLASKLNAQSVPLGGYVATSTLTCQ